MDRPSRPLLCRSPLQPCESLPSLLIRLTKENAYRSASMIARLCYDRLSYRDTITRPTRLHTYEVLADLIMIEVEKLCAASVHHLATTVMPSSFRLSTRERDAEPTLPTLNNSFLREHTWPESDAQFCPLCLREAAYHRLTWMPLAVSACLIHRCLLLRGCPACLSSLTIADILETRCPACGFELTMAPVVDLSTDQMGMFAQAMIQAWLGISPRLDAMLPDSLPDQLFNDN